MTNLVDLDQALATFLEDGPNTAPEAPVIAALAHARTTPRRPDPLLRFRSDVMAPPRTFGALSRPGLLVGLAALLIAGVAVAVIGSRSNEPSVVTPSPSNSAEPTSSAERFSNAPVPLFSGELQLVLAAGQPMTVTVTDTTGALVAATSGTPGDGASGEEGKVDVAADPADPRVLIAKWIGMPCETGAAMIVDESASAISISHPKCSGDTVAFDRVVRLTFRGPIDASSWHGTVIEEPEGGPSSSLPAGTTHVDLSSTADSSVSIDIVDQSGHLTGAAAGPKNEGASVEFITASNVDPSTVRVAWPGSTCDTVHRLTIAADFGLTIDRPNCQAGADVVERSLILTFDRAVDANTLDTGLFSGRAGSGVPTWSVSGTDSGDGRYELALVDGSATVVAISSVDPSRLGVFPPGNTGLDTLSAQAIRLSWGGHACEAAPRLTIDPAGHEWGLVVDVCPDTTPAVVRAVDLTFEVAPPVSSIRFTGPSAP
jgi:hypothetical protein